MSIVHYNILYKYSSVYEVFSTVRYTFSPFVTRRPKLQEAVEYATPMWRTQRPTVFPKSTMDVITSSPQFVDVAVNSGSMVFSRALASQPTASNDQNIFAIESLKSVLQCTTDLNVPRDDWFERFCANVHPDNLNYEPGYITDRFVYSPAKSRPHMLRKTAVYLDTLLQRYPTSLMRACVGYAILRTYTWREVSWSRLSKQGKLIQGRRPHKLWEPICRRAWSLRLAAEEFAKTPTRRLHQISETSVLQAIRTFDIYTGAVVYANPLWPWMSTDDWSAYSQFTADLNSILMQCPVKTSNWSDNRSLDTIYKEVTSWIEESFARGAGFFILNTQSSNFPQPDDLYSWLRTRYGRHLLLVEEVATQISAQQPFSEWFGTIRNPTL